MTIDLYSMSLVHILAKVDLGIGLSQASEVLHIGLVGILSHLWLM
jgi:hypothetical protein